MNSRNIRILLSVFFLFTTPLVSLARGGDPAVDDALSVLEKTYSEVRRTVLDNGMICLVKEDHSAPVVAVQIWVRAGSVHEGNYLGSGLAHYLEHMLFKGTTNRTTAQITRDIDNAGGSINAYTSLDRMVLHATVPSEAWKTGLDVLSDAAMNSTMPEEEWRNEKDVVMREIAMRLDDPDRVVANLAWSTAFSVHPFRHPVLGHRELLEETTRDDLLRFYRARYVPRNMITVVVGDIDAKEVERELGRIYASFERRPGVDAVPPEEPAQVAPRSARKEGAWNVSRLEWVYHTVPMAHEDMYPLDVLAQIVAGGRSARLTAELKEERRLVYHIGAASYTPRDPGVFAIFAVFDPAKEGEVVKAIQQQVVLWQRTPFTEKEIRKAVRQLATEELIDLSTMAGQARSFAVGEFYANDPAYAVTYLRKLNSVTPEDLARVAKKYLATENRTVAILAPSGTTGSSAEDLPAEISQAVNVVRTSLDNGVPLLVREDHRLPFVYFCIACRGGQLSENADNAGIMQMMAQLMVRGTRKRSAEEIAEEYESLGATLSPFSGRNSFGLRASCLSSDTEFMASLLSDCLINSRFPNDEVAKEKILQTAEIDRMHEMPDFIGRDALAAVIHTNHPYRFPLPGTKETVAGIRWKDLVRQHEEHVVAGNVVVAVFGDITVAEARKSAQRHFGRIRAGNRPRFARKEAVPRLPARIELRVPREQAVFLVAYPGISLDDPRYDAFRIMDHAASGLSSELMTEIREKRGLAYYGGAFLVPGLEPGMLGFIVGTRQHAITEVEKLVNAEIDRLADEGLSNEEFLRARRQIIASSEMELQSNSSLALGCALDELYGFGFQHHLDVRQRFEALTPNDVRKAMRSALRDNSKVVCIVLPETSGDTREK
jgi:zinc protease